jgi:hypothetical protein
MVVVVVLVGYGVGAGVVGAGVVGAELSLSWEVGDTPPVEEGLALEGELSGAQSNSKVEYDAQG